MVLPVGQCERGADADPHRQDAGGARLHRPRRRPVRAPCRRGGAGRIGLSAGQLERWGGPRWPRPRATHRRRCAASHAPPRGGAGARRLLLGGEAEPLRRRRRDPALARRRRRRWRTPRPIPAASSPTPPTRSWSPATATRSRRSPTGSAPPPSALATPQRPARRLPPARGRGAAPARQRAAPGRRARQRRRHQPAARLDPDQASAAIDSAPAAGDRGRRRGQPVPERPDRAADRPGAPPGRGRRDRLFDRPALRRLGDRARLVERPRPRPRGAPEPGAPDPDRQRRQPHLERARHPARPGHAGGGAAERRGAAARRHRRRGRAGIARTSARTARPPGGRLGPPVSGSVTRTYNRQSERRRLRRRRPAPRCTPPPPARSRWSPRRSAGSAPSCSSATRTT